MDKFRVPAPEIPPHIFTINVNFLLTIIFKVCIIYPMLETIMINFAIGALYLMIGGAIFFWIMDYLCDMLDDLNEMSLVEFVLGVTLCIAIGFAVT